MMPRPDTDADAPLCVQLVMWTVPDRPLSSLARWRRCDQQRSLRRLRLSGLLAQVDDQVLLYVEGPLAACQWLSHQVAELLGVRGMRLHLGPLAARRLRGCHVLDHGHPVLGRPAPQPAPALGLRHRLQRGPRDDAADLMLVFLTLYRPGRAGW